MKTSGGFFKDKAVVGLKTITGDRIDVAILKATSTNVEVPRENYVKYLVHVIAYGDSGKQGKKGKWIEDYIVSELTKRTHSHNWIVVLKALIVLHRLCRDAPCRNLENSFMKRDAFNYMKIKNVEKSLSGSQQKLFIIQYVDYLRCLGKVLPRQLSSNSFCFDVIDLKSEDGQLLLLTAEQLPEIAFREEAMDNFITLEAFRLLLLDGENLSKHLKLGLEEIMKSASADLSSQNATKDLEVCRRATEAMTGLRNYFWSVAHSNISFGDPIPQLEGPPSMESMYTRLQHARTSVPPGRRKSVNRASQGSEPSRVSTAFPVDSTRRGSAPLQREGYRQKIDDDDDEILQKVLRLSRIEAGLPEEPSVETSPKKVEQQPMSSTRKRESNDIAAVSSCGTLGKEQNLPSCSPDHAEKKTSSPNFSLDDLFLEDKSATTASIPPHNPPSTGVGFAAPPPCSSAVPSAMPAGSSSSLPPGFLLPVVTNPIYMNPQVTVNPPILHAGGEWETGVPTAPLDSSLLPSNAGLVEDSGNSGTGAPINLARQTPSSATIISSNCGYPLSSSFVKGTSDYNLQVRRESQTIPVGEEYVSFPYAVTPTPASLPTTHQDPFKNLYLAATNSNQ